MKSINCNNEQQRIAQAIVDKLLEFGIQLELADIIVGASVTRYVFSVLSKRTRMSELRRYVDDIKCCAETLDEIMIQAPLHGTSTIGIDIANTERRLINLRDILESSAFANARGDLVFAIGEDVSGNAVIADLTKLPHILVAGTTGSGKSIFLNDLIVSLIYKYSPDYVRFIMVDPKLVEWSNYNGIPHMLAPETVTDAGDALAAMDYLIAEMESRYKLFSQSNVVNIRDYNNTIGAQSGQRLPYLVFVVDELAEIMTVNKMAFETRLMRLAQKSRAAGIHVVLATQRPSVDIVSGTIKANMPCRAAFKVCSVLDSQTILCGGGAEKLIGRGDMLFMDPSSNNLRRIQCAYVSNNEVRLFVNSAAQVYTASFDKSVTDQIFVSHLPSNREASNDNEPSDELAARIREVYPYLKKALRYWLERCNGKASISSLQRGLGIGFCLSGRVLETLQSLGYVDPYSEEVYKYIRPMSVRVTLDELDKLFPNTDE